MWRDRSTMGFRLHSPPIHTLSLWSWDLSSNPSSGLGWPGWDHVSINKPITGRGNGIAVLPPGAQEWNELSWEQAGLRVGKTWFTIANQEMLPKQGKQMSTPLSCLVLQTLIIVHFLQNTVLLVNHMCYYLINMFITLFLYLALYFKIHLFISLL